MGKGSRVRPLAVPKEEWDRQYERIFKVKPTTPPTKTKPRRRKVP